MLRMGVRPCEPFGFGVGGLGAARASHHCGGVFSRGWAVIPVPVLDIHLSVAARLSKTGRRIAHWRAVKAERADEFWRIPEGPA